MPKGLGFIVGLFFGLISVWNQEAPAVQKREIEQQPLLYHYADFSAFHRQGVLLWVGDQGMTDLQTSTRQPQSVNRVFEFQLTDAQMKNLKALLAKLNNAVASMPARRRGIPDEVAVRLQWLDADGRFQTYEVWEKEWPSSGVWSELRQFIQSLVAQTETMEPLKLSLEPGEVFLPFRIAPGSAVKRKGVN